MNEWILLLGLGVLTAAFRTFEHRIFQRLWVAGLLGTSFYAGWLLFGHPAAGLFGILIWPALPWIELLTRVRSMRLPLARKVSQMPPPSSHSFPALADLTEEVESEGFDFLRDAGWQWGAFRQNYRLFYRKDDRTMAAITLVTQEGMNFFFLSISSRDISGRNWITWNNPFPPNMKLPPNVRLNRQRPDLSFFDMYQNHLGILALNNVTTQNLVDQDAESALEFLEHDLRSQIDHNLRAGILRKIDEESVAYSLRGLFFIWTQFLSEFLRAR